MVPIVWLAAGAAAMYFFDPEKGEARRMQMRSRFDQFSTEHPDFVDAAEGKTIHLRNRAKGLLHETRAKIERSIDPPADTSTSMDRGMHGDMSHEAPPDAPDRAA